MANQARQPGRSDPDGRLVLLADQDRTTWDRAAITEADGFVAWPTPVVALNRAVAVSMVDGPQAALREVDRLAASSPISSYRYLPAVRADFLRRMGRPEDALAAYAEALRLTDNEAERRFLQDRIAQLHSPSDASRLDRESCCR